MAEEARGPPAATGALEPVPGMEESSKRKARPSAGPPRPFPVDAFPSWAPWNPPRAPVETSQKRWTRIATLVTIFVLALGFYQYRIDQPPSIVFDETHYIKHARDHTRSVFIDTNWKDDPRPLNFEHPPIGKYLIAVGIWLSGNRHADLGHDAYAKLCGQDRPECARDARGWRVASTLAGASGIVAIYLLGMRLFNRVSAGLLAAGLLMLDGMYYIHARLAMLDVFPTAFALWAFAFALSPWERGRTLSGIFFGLGLASKYYVLFLLPVFFLCHFVRTPPPRWKNPLTLPTGSASIRARVAVRLGALRPWIARGLPALGPAVGWPLFILLLSYMPYLFLWSRDGGVLFAFRQLLLVQQAAFSWDFGAKLAHPYASRPGSWLFLATPVYYYIHDYPGGYVGRMWAIGNPVLWWAAVGGIAISMARIVLRFLRDYGWHYLRMDAFRHVVYHPLWIRRDLAFFLAGLLFVFSYAPWFVLRRITFLFYMTFVVPTFALFLGGLLAERWQRGRGSRIFVIALLTMVAGAFLLFYPIVSGYPIRRDHYERLMGWLPFLDVQY